jgi:hypothetical protein
MSTLVRGSDRNRFGMPVRQESLEVRDGERENLKSLLGSSGANVLTRERLATPREASLAWLSGDRRCEA